MNAASAPAPVETLEPEVTEDTALDSPWVVIVWNDPINLMSYVAFVFRKLFGYSKEEAERLMMQVHHDGKAVVSSGSRSDAERDVFRLHEHGLWATMQQD
ncbi:MAG: ATP-dependent Clp protease adapter ClpS [Microthrixaceae bacterium]